MQKFKNKEKILEGRWEDTHTQRAKDKNDQTNYVSKIKKKKDIFKVLIGKYRPARGLCPVKIPFENEGEIKAFPKANNKKQSEIHD